ncbi:hypothetical protein GCM10011409_45940 [Lentibacillus populi]|uniref:Uncharacterized protein n=1 Tax=Lentibacillus populi TaxID=1827502 RepID=A0A9W5U264_9BACI|nr:hypothetical protein [Lentibacillus populi]GGB63694.1 hypothetical protein GCM10011409_45940 [Lentibacillus populi]
MTNADRLAKAIQALGEFADLKAEYAIKFVDEYAEFLIQRAERVEESEKENKRLEKFIDNLQVVHFTELQTEKAENARYKQALEFYADEQDYITFDSPAVRDSGYKARKALRGDKHA